jgi:hypothetical protein
MATLLPLKLSSMFANSLVRKVFMGNWIPLEMSLVGTKEVAI